MVNRVLAWLKVEWRGRSLRRAIILAPLLSLAYIFTALIVLAIFGLLDNMESATGYDRDIFTWSFPLIVLGAVIVEEIIFRFPLSFVSRRWGASRRMLLLALVLSVLFGWVHGSWHHIILQGVVGFWWCLVFLKAGGLQQRYWKALFVTIMVHTINNALIISLVALLGETHI